MSGEARLIRTDPVALGVWKRLTSLFATWRLIVIAGYTRRALFMFSNDQMTPLMRAGHWKIGLGLLGGLDDDQVEFLARFADINARKVDRLFRAAALILVSVPVAATFGISEIDPDFWTRIGFTRLESVIAILGVWLVASALMMAAAWRARDIADLLEFEAARRRLDLARPGETTP